MSETNDNLLYVKITGALDHKLLHDSLISKSWTVSSLHTRDVKGYNIEFRNSKDKMLFKLKYGL